MAIYTVANPEHMLGAKACLDMLCAIDRLKTVVVQPRSDLAGAEGPHRGRRADFASADQIVAAALDAHVANPGFRQALVNFVICVFHVGTPKLDQYDAALLLTASGLRPIDANGNAEVFEAGTSQTSTAELRGLLADVGSMCMAIGNVAEQQPSDEAMAAALYAIQACVEKQDRLLGRVFDEMDRLLPEVSHG